MAYLQFVAVELIAVAVAASRVALEGVAKGSPIDVAFHDSSVDIEVELDVHAARGEGVGVELALKAVAVHVVVEQVLSSVTEGNASCVGEVEGGLDAQAVVAVPGEEQGVGLGGRDIMHVKHTGEQVLALGCRVAVEAKSLRGGTQRLLLRQQHAAVEGQIGESDTSPRHLDDTSVGHLVEALGGIGRAVQVHLLGAGGGEGVAVELPHHVDARGAPHDPSVAQRKQFRTFPEAGDVALRRPVGKVR